MKGARTNDIAARVALAKQRWNSEREIVDGTGGYGAGVIDALIQGGHSPLEFQFSGKAIDSRYLNKRAEIWFEMQKWIKRGGALPNDATLLKEMVAPTYTFKNGKFMLEPKEQIKARLGFSPDRADALAMTFAEPEAGAFDTEKARLGISNQNRVRTEPDQDQHGNRMSTEPTDGERY